MTEQRVREPQDGTDERALLLDWLAFHRDALTAKCAGLDPEQLVRRAVPPSALSLVGLVRHLTEMERVYLSQPLTGQPTELLYCTNEEPDGDFAPDGPIDVAASIARWRAECTRSDAALANIADVSVVSPGKRRTVRWLLLKLIGEYARHNGHADLVREAIDGQTGE